VGRALIHTILLALFLAIPVCRANDDADIAKYRDFGHMTGLIGNYLSRPSGQLAMELVGEFRLTFYWIARETESDGRKTERILVRCPETSDEHPVDVAPAFKRRLDREGTAILEDGRLINVWRRGETERYLDISTVYPTGLGSRNNPLTPFISVAVNSTNPKLSFGDRLFIPDVEGVPLPDGGHHDGIFTVDDAGQGIGQDQIDVFVSMKGNWPEYKRHLQAHAQRFFVHEALQHDDPGPSKSPAQPTATRSKSRGPGPATSPRSPGR